MSAVLLLEFGSRDAGGPGRWGESNLASSASETLKPAEEEFW